MKRFFLFLFLSVMFFSAYSQFKFGVSAGLTGSQVDGDNLEGFHKLGVMGGIFVNRQISDSKHHLQMEFNFIQKGSRQNEDPEAGIFTKYIMRLNYFEVPLIYTNKLYDYMWVQGGLKFGYLISAAEYDSYGELPKVAGTPEFRDMDYSIFIGLNSKLYKKIRVALRYSYSLRVIRPHQSNVSLYLNTGQRNEVITLALQYQF